MGLATRNTSAAISSTQTSVPGSNALVAPARATSEFVSPTSECKRAKSRDTGPTHDEWRASCFIAGAAAGRRSHAEGVAPLLDHLRDAFGDFLHRQADGLYVLCRLRAGRGRYLGPQRLEEMIDPDLRCLNAEQIFHEQPRRVGMLHSLHDGGGRDDEHRAVCGIDHCHRITLLRARHGGPDGAGGDETLARIEHGYRVVDRAADLRIVLGQLLEKLPAVELAHRHHP